LVRIEDNIEEGGKAMAKRTGEMADLIAAAAVASSASRPEVESGAEDRVAKSASQSFSLVAFALNVNENERRRSAEREAEVSQKV